MNLANKITIARILLIPIFMIFLLARIPGGNVIASIIFIVAALTDSIDGYVARSRNQITKLGKFMDPLADKLLVTAALVSLVELDKLAAWAVVIIISRELIVSVFRAVAASEGIVIAASPWGKAKTISQIIAIVLLLFDNYTFSLYNIDIATIAVGVSVTLTAISGYDYIYKNKKVLM